MGRTGCAETSVLNYHYSRVIFQKSADLIYIAAETWSHAHENVIFKASCASRISDVLEPLCDHPWLYRGADKSLVRPGTKQARKHVRDARDFNNIETRAVIKFFFLRQGAEGNSRHSDRNISLFPSWFWLRTYQHPCTVRNWLRIGDANCHQVFFFKARRWRKLTPFWQKHYLISVLVGLRTYQHPCTVRNRLRIGAFGSLLCSEHGKAPSDVRQGRNFPNKTVWQLNTLMWKSNRTRALTVVP